MSSRTSSKVPRYAWLSTPVSAETKAEAVAFARKHDRSIAYILREALRLYLRSSKPPPRSPPTFEG